MSKDNKDLKSKSLDELKDIVFAFGQKSFQAKNLFSWIHQKDALQLADMTTLSKEFRASLAEKGYYVSQLKELLKQEDSSDGTIKFLFGLQDELKIETVLLNDDERITLCISSQVGCKMGCSFCATGSMGFARDLSAGEIVDQIIAVERITGKKVNNVVYMGMGEPLDNYEEVMKSVRILNSSLGKNIGARHITISTIGIPEAIEQLAEEKLQIRLAVSLHAPTDKLRSKLMKINKKYPIDKIFDSLRKYQKISGRRVMFEYIMIKDFNDSRIQAKGLAKLISGLKTNVNLIEYNPHSKADYQPSVRDNIRDFRWILQDRGFETTIRYRRGREIDAACGQLGQYDQ